MEASTKLFIHFSRLGNRLRRCPLAASRGVCDEILQDGKVGLVGELTLGDQGLHLLLNPQGVGCVLVGNGAVAREHVGDLGLILPHLGLLCLGALDRRRGLAQIGDGGGQGFATMVDVGMQPW